MAVTVKPDELAEAIGEELSQYFDNLNEAVKQAVRQTSQECRDEIKRRSPKRTGKYRKSWAITEVLNRHGSIRLVVHNKKHYRLTHLLENGHAKKSGGRVESIPHIGPAEKHAEQNLMKRVEEAIKNDA